MESVSPMSCLVTALLRLTLTRMTCDRQPTPLLREYTTHHRHTLPNAMELLTLFAIAIDLRRFYLDAATTEELITPAVQGTIGIMQSAHKNKSVPVFPLSSSQF